MVDEGLVVAIGSDIHNEDKNAYKKFKKAIKVLGANAERIALESNKIIL